MLGKIRTDAGATASPSELRAAKREQNQVTELQNALDCKDTQIAELKAELLELYRRVDRNY